MAELSHTLCGVANAHMATYVFGLGLGRAHLPAHSPACPLPCLPLTASLPFPPSPLSLAPPPLWLLPPPPASTQPAPGLLAG